MKYRTAQQQYLKHVMRCSTPDPRKCQRCWDLERDASAESWRSNLRKEATTHAASTAAEDSTGASRG